MVYCETHFRALVGVSCRVCGEHVQGPAMMVNQTHAVHPPCVACHACQSDLRGKQMGVVIESSTPGSLPHDGADVVLLFCAEHYRERMAPKCNQCLLPLLTGFVQLHGGVSEGKYHPDCLVCASEGCVARVEQQCSPDPQSWKLYCSEAHRVATVAAAQAGAGGED